MSEEERQFIAYYDAYAEAIFRHGLRALNNRERALDVMQDTFLKTWRYQQQGHTIEHMQAFLYQVATNLIRNEITRRKPVHSLTAWMADTGYEPHDASVSVERDVEAAWLMTALSRLHERHRAILEARYLEGCTLREMAERFAISPTAAGVRVHRALAKLRGLLDSPIQ